MLLCIIVEPPIIDPPNKGHYVKYKGHESIRDSMFDPKILNSFMNDSKYNLLIKDNLSIKDKCDFVLVPKCPLFRGSTVSIDSTGYLYHR